MNEKAKHTPGPWEAVSIDPSFLNYSIYGSDKKKVCELDIDMSCEEERANAHLIAAAPELLEALEGLVRINEEHNAAVEATIGRPVNWKDDYLNAARAAIAKTKGEVPQPEQP